AFSTLAVACFLQYGGRRFPRRSATRTPAAAPEPVLEEEHPMKHSHRWMACGAAVVALLAGAALGPGPAEAQYFGRNKVKYRTFDFRILETPHFDIYYYPEEEAAVRDAARMAERWYTRLSEVLQHDFEERQPIIFYASHPDFQQTTTYGGFISEGTGGFTEVFKQRVVMPFTYSYEETDHVLGHELVHAF